MKKLLLSIATVAIFFAGTPAFASTANGTAKTEAQACQMAKDSATMTFGAKSTSSCQ